VIALVLVFRGLGVVPAALLERELNFRSRTVAEVVSTVVQFLLFLGLALAGLGVWSLVLGNVAAAAVQTLAYWLLTPWRPSPRRASRRVLLELMRYGRFVGATNILTVVSNTIDTFTVGRLLGATAVGFYSVSFRLANFPTAVIAFLLGRTMFAAYSLLQDDRAGFRHAYLRNLERISLFAVPVSVGLAVGAEPIVLALLGEKWVAAVLPLRILGVYGLIKSFGGATTEALKGMGKPHVPLAFGGLYAAIVIPALFVLTPLLGLEGAALSMLIATALTVVPEVGVAMRGLGIRLRDLARTLAAPALCASLLAASLALLLPVADSLSPGAALALLATAGFAVYVAATAMFARSVLVALWTSIRAARPAPAAAAVPFSATRDEGCPQRP
jgi:O-antigen/teichoic acid export membrane protein